jgi:uncharacterized membrane protein
MLIFLLIIISFFILFSSAASAQKITLFTTNSSVYSSGDIAYFEALIENGEEMLVNYKNEFMIMKTSDWEYITIPGDTIVYRADTPLNLQPNETKKLEFRWEIPTSAESGIYRAYYRIKSESGLSKGFLAKLFEIKDANKQVKAVRLWGLEFVYNNDSGSALEGFHVNPNSKMLAQFTISNAGNTILNLKIIINFTYTFHPDKSAFSGEKLISLNPYETKKVVFNITSPAKPTTYTPIITVWSEGNMLGQLIGRLVVVGYGGTILNARSDKLAYIKGETVRITAEVTGSADYESELKQVDLYCKILDSKGKEILSEKKTFNLGFNPMQIAFNSLAPKNFVDYILFCSLKKGDKTLDEFKSIYVDGKLPIVEEKGKFDWYLLILGVVPLILTIILILYMYQKGKKHEENHNFS